MRLNPHVPTSVYLGNIFLAGWTKSLVGSPNKQFIFFHLISTACATHVTGIKHYIYMAVLSGFLTDRSQILFKLIVKDMATAIIDPLLKL